MGGVQAQYAPSIYIGLWSRVEGLERDQVTRALERRALVQATLLRNTIHVVSPGDYWQFAEATRDSRRELLAAGARQARAHRKEVEAAARRMRRVLGDGAADRKELMPLADGDPSLFNGATLWLDVVRVPPAGTWEHRRADIYARAEAWLERERPEHPRRHTVARYLGRLRPRRRRRHRELVRDPAGGAEAGARETWSCGASATSGGGLLLDLPRRPLPDASTKAPVRFLPTWDATLLVHARRTGILPERFRSQVFSTKTPQSVPTFTVDGQVAGSWREEKGKVRVEAVRAAAEGGPPRGGRGSRSPGGVHRLRAAQ